jgi:hypothetical protein
LEDEFGPTLAVTDEFSNQANKSGRVVVLKHIFTTEQLEEDSALLLDLKEDVREERAILREATNVVLYDVSELPVFLIPGSRRDPISAKACMIVSPPFHRYAPTFVPNSHSKLAENASSPAIEWKHIPTRVNSGSNFQKERTKTCSEMT